MKPLIKGWISQTEIPVSELTGWLEDNCRGDWAVEIEQPDMDPPDRDPPGTSLDEVSLIILFEKNADKHTFLTDFA